MDDVLLAQFERILEAGIQLLPTTQIPNHFVFERNGCVVLVERRETGFGGIGSPGLLTERGFEALVEVDGRDVFVFKGEVRAAEPGQADAARSLLKDLKQALS